MATSRMRRGLALAAACLGERAPWRDRRDAVLWRGHEVGGSWRYGRCEAGSATIAAAPPCQAALYASTAALSVPASGVA